jgi:hypothetical protein
VPITIGEIGGAPERPPPQSGQEPPPAAQPERQAVEAAALRALELIALARERDARLAPP